MAIYQPSVLKAFLNENELTPKRGYSQNFLIDGNVVRKTLKILEISPGDIILEIGPGPGVFLEQLLKHEITLIAIEKDKKLAQLLSRFHSSSLIIKECDALDIDYEDLFSTYAAAGRHIKIISNLPFKLTSPFLSKLLPLHHLVDRCVFIMQKDVAKKVCASHGGKDFGSLSIFSTLHSDAKLEFDIPRTCYHPRPKVETSVVSFSLKDPTKWVSSPQDFLSFTKNLFLQRRKMISSILKKSYESDALISSFAKLNLSGKERAETLPLDTLLALYQNLSGFEL